MSTHRKILVLAVISVVLIIVFAAARLHAERYDEEVYFKDYVSNKGENLVVAVNRDSNEIELYWSDANQTWLKPSKQEQRGLQILYASKLQLRGMQDNLKRMLYSTIYNKSEDSFSRR